MAAPRIALLLALALSAGCLDTQSERIEVRRDPDELRRKRETNKLSYDEFLELRKNEKQQLEWDLGFSGGEGGRADAGLWLAVPQYAIRESLTHDEESREQVRALVAGIPEDPFRSFEQDRRDALWKEWSDRRTSLDKLEPDTDGPPGWLGPKAAPALPGPLTPPKAEGEAEGEGDAE